MYSTLCSAILNANAGEASGRRESNGSLGAGSVRTTRRTSRLQDGCRGLELDGAVVIGVGIMSAVFRGHLVRQVVVQADAHRTVLGKDGGPYGELPFLAANAVDRLLVALFSHGMADHGVHIRQQIANRASRQVVAIPLGRIALACVPSVLPGSVAVTRVPLFAHQQLVFFHLERRITAA